MAYVHRVGNRVARRRDFFVAAAGEKAGELVVGIDRRDDFFHRQTHLPRHDRAHGVAEIAAGNGKNRRLAGFGDARRGVKIIDALRQQPADVDGVGGRQRNGPERRIGKGAFHQRLAIVERAVYGDRADVVPQRGHLLPLAVADLGDGEQHQHADPVHAVKRAGHGRAGIPACGRQDRQGPARFAHKTADQPRHHPGRKILEGGGGSPVQPQDLDPSRDRFQRHIIVVGLDAKRVQRRVVNRARGETAQHFKGNFGVTLMGKRSDLFPREPGITLRQVQAAIGRLTLKQSVPQAHPWGFAVGAVE